MTQKTPKNLPLALETRGQESKRLSSPSAGRNRGIISKTLAQNLPRGARVLEIASGSGEHGVAICQLRPDIIWQASDPDEASRESQNAWASTCQGQILPSLNIDTMKTGWADGLEQFDAIFCANMIHIAPWEAAEGLAIGAGRLCRSGGQMLLYGPFLEGDKTAPSNLDFDASLKSRNSAWGVRKLDSVKHIFSGAGFTLAAPLVMPKENRMLIFTKSQ